MLFDRIFEDSLGFIRRKLWSEQDNSGASKQPFQSAKSISGEFGIIHLLEGRDTPRAVRTWMYTPKRQQLNSAQMVATSIPMDLHIYTDFLGPLPHVNTPSAIEEREAIANQREKGLSVPTHRVQLLKASHFLNDAGLYDLEILYWQDIDCSPPAGSGLSDKTSRKIAMRLTDSLAFKCLELASPLKTESETWESAIADLLEDARAKIIPK